MRALWIPVVLGMLVGGCHDLPDLGYCGNGVAEQNLGEACDDGGASTRCTATCELACVPVADKPATYVAAANDPDYACPDDTYTCAADSQTVHICRAPSGRFSLATPIFFDVDESPSATDLNGDGYADLVGTNASTITSLFGGPLGDALTSGSEQPAPASLGPLRVFERPILEGDPSPYPSTIVVPSSGLAFLNSDGSEYVPEAALDFPVTLDESAIRFVTNYPDVDADFHYILGDVVMFARPQYQAGVMATGRQLHRLEIMTVGATKPDVVADTEEIADCNLPGDSGESWTTVGVIATAGKSTFVVVSTSDNSDRWNVCRYTRVVESGSLQGHWDVTVHQIAVHPPQSGSDQRPTIALADVEADRCAELVYQDRGTTRVLKSQLVDANSCDFSEQAPEGLPDVGGHFLGAASLFDATAIIFTDSGAYRYESQVDVTVNPPLVVTAWFPKLAPQGGTTWAAVAFTDITGDGKLDAVLSRSANNEQLDDLDVVRAAPVLTSYRADTTAPVRKLIPGDYDGDGVGDIAFLESAGLKDRIAMVYGVRGGLLSAPRAVTQALNKLEIERMTSFYWAPTSQPHDGLDDLVIAYDDGHGLKSGFMMGDPRRVPTIPRYAPFNSGVKGFADVVAGRFFAPSSDAPWLVGAASMQSVLAHDYVSKDSWRIIPILSSGPDPAMPAFSAPLGALRAGVFTRVVGTSNDGSFRILQLLPPDTANPQGRELTVCDGPIVSGKKAIGYSGIDLDGDGNDELVINYAVGGLTSAIAVFDVHACTVALRLTADALQYDLASCAQLLKVNGQLYALCSPHTGDGATVVAVEYPPSDVQHPAMTTVGVIGGGRRFLTAGDFDGDGVVDLAATTSLGNGAAVTLLHQCTTSDLRSCPPP